MIQNLERAQNLLGEAKNLWISQGKLGWCAEVVEACTYMMEGGKGARPALLLWSARATENKSSREKKFAALEQRCSEPLLALEMVHVYSLIHDDLPAMDNDDFRRGKPTLHKKLGEALAVLAGDALLTGAFEVLAGASVDDGRRVLLVKELARAAGAAGMIAGQAWDIAAEKSGATDLDLWTKIHDAKTGALFGAALAMGFIVANERVSMAELDHVRDWGIRLGRLFQIVDDRLDQGPFYKKLGPAKLAELCAAESAQLRASALQIWGSPPDLETVLDFFVNRQA